MSYCKVVGDPEPPPVTRTLFSSMSMLTVAGASSVKLSVTVVLLSVLNTTIFVFSSIPRRFRHQTEENTKRSWPERMVASLPADAADCLINAVIVTLNQRSDVGSHTVCADIYRCRNPFQNRASHITREDGREFIVCDRPLYVSRQLGV